MAEAITDSEVAAVTLQRYIYTCKTVHKEGVLYHLSKLSAISGHLHMISRRRTQSNGRANTINPYG